MICDACNHENRPGAKFCGGCGSSLARSCPGCGTAVAENERFCTECGTALTTTTEAPSSPVPAGGERKHITVLFADVAGSMDLQERLDAELWAQIMGRFVSILAEGVRKYGGTVDKFTGDGIMALFGAPVAQEDHARRACHAAWHLTKAIGEYSGELRHTHDIELHVRLGLNSGEVIVGRVADDVPLDPTALGHTVGLAQRMEAMADPGKAYLTEYTAHLVEGWFRLEDLGPRPVKGASEELRVYGLGAALPAPVRRAVGASPLVGRMRELAVLEDALAMASEGNFQVVGVVGEAGVGKSRLCDEFARSVTGRGITVRRAAGVSHGREVPLLPILAFQRDYFGISDADDGETARSKVTERLLRLDPSLEDALPLLFDFLEVPDPDRPVPPLAPEVRMRRIFEAVRRITARRSQRETLVLIFEDLHWFDSQSEVFLERLIESYPGSRTLVVANFRPEFTGPWTRHSYYRQLPLAPLHDDAVGELLGELLGTNFSLAPLLRFVQERTGGNPFFVEELVRALIEDGTLAGDRGSYHLTRSLHEVKVPPSVHAVLGARIDRLPSEYKTVLQTAAVIGRVFDAAVLARVIDPAGEELDDVLSALCAAELLQEVPGGATFEYRFWHPLTQEVAYSSLLADRRRHLHAAVAEALMVGNTDRLDELAAVLAWHWEQAGADFEAAAWNMRAGEWALRNDLSEAQRRWRAVLDLATTEDTSEALELRVRARIRLVQFGARVDLDPEEAERLFAEGRAEAERLGNDTLRALNTFLSGSGKVFLGDFAGGLDRFLEGARLADEGGDRGLQAAVGMGPAYIFSSIGPVSEGLNWADRTISICADDAQVGTDLFGYSVLARMLHFRAVLLARAGRLSEATASLQRGIALARPTTESEVLSWALAFVPQLNWLSGQAGETPEPALEAVRLSEDTGSTVGLVLALEGLAFSHLPNRPSEASAVCDRALVGARTHGAGLFEAAPLLTCLAQARLAMGDIDGAGKAAAESVAVARRQGARILECFALLIRARIARLAEIRASTVADDLTSALSLVQKTGALAYEPFIREELGRLRGDETGLSRALQLYRQIGAAGHVRRLEVELSTKASR